MSDRTHYTHASITKEVAEALVAKYGGTTLAARAIRPDFRDRYGNIPSINAIEICIRKVLRGYGPVVQPRVFDQADAEKINQLKNLLDEANIPIDSIGRIEHAKVRAGFHEGLTKGEDGEPVVTRLRSKSATIVLSPKWAEGPQWPVIQPAPPVIVKFPGGPGASKIRTDRGLRRVAVISDTQIGFLRRQDTGELVPTHDPKAIDLALQIVRDIAPCQIIYVGDFLDFPEMSRWLQMPEYVGMTQPAIDEGGRILELFEAAAGKDRAPTIFVAGNHDRRLREYNVKNAMASSRLRPAGEPPEGWNEEASIERLLNFKRLGIQYAGEYPGGECWITPELVVRHNPEGKYSYDASVIAGHTHKISRTTTTLRTSTGARNHTLYEIGCLCSLENFPDRRSLMATAVPSGRPFVKDWAQGFAIVHADSDGRYNVEQVEFNVVNGNLQCLRPTGMLYG